MPRIVVTLMAACLVASVLLGAVPDRAAAADAMPVLTVTGAIKSTNRPPFDPFRDTLFNALDTSFEKAYTLNRKDLVAMPQVRIEVRYPGWPHPVRVRGPLLKDVLALVGVTGTTVTVHGLDGFAWEFAIADIQTGTFVLALEADGEPLALGGRGPIWLVFPPGSYAEQSTDDDSGLVWAVFHMRVD